MTDADFEDFARDMADRIIRPVGRPVKKDKQPDDVLTVRYSDWVEWMRAKSSLIVLG